MTPRTYAAVPVLVAVFATGCGAATASHATLRAAHDGAAAAAPAGQLPAKSVVPGSPDLKLAVSPASGGPGTVVHVTATGCIDATGMNHAVSFNATDRSAGRNPHAVRTIESTLSGTSLTATYTVTNADRGAAGGVFYVQCGATVVSAPFRVTR
jgi:hypothetical protein